MRTRILLIQTCLRCLIKVNHRINWQNCPINIWANLQNLLGETPFRPIGKIGPIFLMINWIKWCLSNLFPNLKRFWNVVHQKWCTTFRSTPFFLRFKNWNDSIFVGSVQFDFCELPTLGFRPWVTGKLLAQCFFQEGLVQPVVFAPILRKMLVSVIVGIFYSKSAD